MKTALVFANGSANDGAAVRRALAAVSSSLVVAADGGARVARHYGLTPDIVIGDMDSLSNEESSALHSAGVKFRRFPAEKDQTDLELALRWAVDQGLKDIQIIGGLGGRFDQTMGNVQLLALPELAEARVRLISGNESIWLAKPGNTIIQGEAGDTLSLIPFTAVVHDITTKNLHYPLKGEDLVLGPARGMSNVMETAQAEVTFREGILLIVHTIGTPG